MLMRNAAITAMTAATVTSSAYLIFLEDLGLYRPPVLALSIVLVVTAVLCYVSDQVIRTVRASTEEVRDSFCLETQALHRSMITTMESYGDARAIDAIVSSERRHAVNERTTADVRPNVRGSVTPLRRPQR